MTNDKKTDEEIIETQNEVNTNSHDHSAVVTRQSIGSYLKSVREEKKLSIKVVASHTKISVTNLELLESNRFEELPNIAYLKGFVRNYAKILGLNQDQAVDVLIKTYGKDEEEFHMPSPETEIKVEAPHPLETEIKQETSNKVVKIAGVIVAAVMLSFYLFKNASNNEQANEAASNNTLQEKEYEVVPETTETVVDTNGPSVEVQNLAEAKEELAKIEEQKETPIEVTKVEAPKVEAKIEPKKEEKKEEKKDEKKDEKLELRPIPTPLYSISKKSTDELTEWLPENFKNSVVEGKQNIFINAVEGSSWITYKADNDPVKKFVLEEGKMLMIRGDEVRVFLGNVHVTKIFLNNKLLDISSKSGVKSLVFPNESVQKYRLPLFVFNKDGSVSTSDEIEQE
ncbi:DNA-binding helix-turn-helix protein [Bacteriovorax sp. BSW11_IV]|uniref:helix-turn-helix domain-containing protein n=1 Tax=Bacteriovorax sp. BSW11_IV TaxID=1353529 RepID=UPI00038A1A4F|nr:helix-turn-helix domain-containing protein [Bacteriovorax sp. BSW11_IV]EQC45836.1 DNA-binding helix-turn-helix protein [Bacteriovorax sp. BSW11_IV]